jgi:hypothetical protein
MHHHDIVHFALEFVGRAAASGQSEEVLRQLRDHLYEIQGCRLPTQDAAAPADSQAAARKRKSFFRLNLH